MNKYGFASVAIIALGPACMVKTVFYDVNPAYESHAFNTETIAVCPFNGTWKIEGSDTVFKRGPDFNLYPEAIALEIGKKRKCLSVLHPDVVAQKVPDIGSFLFKHRLTYKKMDKSDSSAFGNLRGGLAADYLLFFESIFFSEEQQTTGENNKAIMENTILVFQIWDLKNTRFMYRGEAKGSGSATRDSRSSKGSVQNTACELVKSLPVCK